MCTFVQFNLISAILTKDEPHTVSDKDRDQKLPILNAAKFIFARHGLARASVDDIARQAGKSRTTLYKYYKNKEQIFEEFILSEISEIVDHAALAIGDAASLQQKLINYNFSKLQLIRMKFQTYQQVITEVCEGSAHLNFFKEHFSAVESTVMKKIFTDSIVLQEINPIAASELDFLVSVITIALRGIEYEAFIGGADEHLEQRLSWLISIVVRGLQ